MIRRLLPLTVAVMALSACTVLVPGRAEPEGWGVDRAAGLTIADGPSGLRADAPEPRLSVDGTDGGAVDRLAAAAVEDVQQYWAERFPELDDRGYRPVRDFLSYDSRARAGRVCGTDTEGLVNAFYCPGDDLVAWDRGELLPSLASAFGEMAVVTVLAHEMGHAVQSRLGVRGRTILLEQQADCYTGSYFRWLAGGGSPRFMLSTGPGLNQVMATLFFIRDRPGAAVDDADAHGNAFDRVSAFQAGFGGGPQRCARIDENEVRQRVTQEGGSAAAAGEGELRLRDSAARADLLATLNAVFGPGQPGLSAAVTCGRGPAVYCVDRDVVGLDVDALDRIGASAEDGGLGDFAAFAEVVSRFALARQHRAGLPITGVGAAQRTACMTGAWAAAIGPDDGQALQLSPGDLDEAVAEMLADQSLIAADAAGTAVPSGFARVEAFGAGFSGGLDGCATLVG